MCLQVQTRHQSPRSQQSTLQMLVSLGLLYCGLKQEVVPSHENCRLMLQELYVGQPVWGFGNAQALKRTLLTRPDQTKQDIYSIPFRSTISPADIQQL